MELFLSAHSFRLPIFLTSTLPFQARDTGSQTWGCSVSKRWNQDFKLLLCSKCGANYHTVDGRNPAPVDR